MKAKACIFDFDGVIMDSEKYHHIAWEKLAHEIGTDFSYEEYKPFKSAGRQVVIPYLMKKANVPFSQEKYDYFFRLRSEAIADALKLVNEKDITPRHCGFFAPAAPKQHSMRRSFRQCNLAPGGTTFWTVSPV